MGSLDLKPLTKDTIEKMGYSDHELWVVKIDDVVYGPFETESLKHYSAENQTLFENALACRIDLHQWDPFFSLGIFQRRQEQVDYIKSEGPFWILVDGQKSHPLTKFDLEKKIEMGILAHTDLVSYDDGHSWHKVFQIPEFDRRRLSADELPQSPTEQSFQKAKLELVEKIENSSHHKNEDGLASLAHLGQKKDKTVILNLDEITIKAIQETEVSKSVKTALFAMVGCVITLSATAYFVFSGPKELPEVAIEEESTPAPRKVIMPEVPAMVDSAPAPAPQAPTRRYDARQMPVRRPASIPPRMEEDRSALTQNSIITDSEFPTVIESHSAERDRHPSAEKDERYPNEMEGEAPSKDEPSLVNNANANGDENQGLDAQMNPPAAVQEPGVEQPIMEEASDF